MPKTLNGDAMEYPSGEQRERRELRLSQHYTKYVFYVTVVTFLMTLLMIKVTIIVNPTYFWFIHFYFGWKNT